jgi:WD40 repeat protein
MTIDAPLPPGPDANVRGENPYVGPVPLSDGQKLYGRERETDELVDLIVSKRVVLLLSPSGAGKTSLIQAALAPALRELYELQPLPIIRLGYFCPDWGTAAVTNRYRLAMLRALERRLPQAEQLTDQALAEYSLARYFQQRLGPTPPGEVSRYWLLIIDQFEELLTVNPLDEEDKRAFLDELGALLAGLDADDGTQVPIWALFAMREDRVAELEPYLDLIPTSLAFRYRMDALALDAAREAIAEPAGDRMSADAAQQLVRDLCTVVVRDAEGVETPRQGRFVEPVQLQVVCRDLWERIVVGEKRSIQADDVATCEASEVDLALRSYFDREVDAAAAGAGVSERRLREWISTQLVTAGGVRTQALRDATALGDIDAAIGRLIDAHLLRSDVRNDREWVELSHDRLLAPIHAANEAWERTHLTPFQMRAKRWQMADAHNDRNWLITGRELEEAREFARQHPDYLNSNEEQFLQACEQEHKRATRERRRYLALGGTAVLAVVALLGYWFFDLKKEQQELEASEKRSEISREVRSTGDYPPVQALDMLVGLRERADALPEGQSLSQRIGRAMRERLGGMPAAVVRGLNPHGHVVWSLVFTGDGRQLLAGSWDGRISLQEPQTTGPAYMTPDQGAETYQVVMYEPTKLVASTYIDGRVVLWRLQGGGLQRIGLLDPTPGRQRRQMTTAAFSADGRMLAVAGWDKMVELWDVSNPAAPRALTAFGESAAPIQKILFLPPPAGGGDERLASTDLEGNVRIWTIAPGQSGRPALWRRFSIRDHLAREVGIFSAAADPSGRYFVAGDSEGFLHVWDLAAANAATSGTRLTVAFHGRGQLDAQVRGIAFAPDSLDFVSVGLDGYVIRWRLPANATGPDDIDSRTVAKRYGEVGERLYSTTYQPGSDDVIAVGGTRSIWLVDLKRGNGSVLAKPLPFTGIEPAAWRALSLDRNSSVLAAAGPDDRIHFWKKIGNGLQQQPQWSLSTGRRAAFVLEPGGTHLISADCDGKVLRWALREGAAAQRAVLSGGDGEGHGDAKCVPATPAVSNDGQFLVTSVGAKLSLWRRGSDDSWRLQSTQLLTRPVVDPSLGKNEDPIASLAFGPGSDRLAVGSEAGLIRLWLKARDNPTFSTDRRWVDAGKNVLALAFRPDGNVVVSGGEDGWLAQWNVPELTRIKNPVPHHERAVTALAYSAPARGADAVLVSADRDGNVVEWSKGSITGSTIDIAPRSGKPVNAIALGADGTFLVTAGEELLAWDYSPANVEATARALTGRPARAVATAKARGK